MIMHIVRIIVQITDNIFFSQKIEHMDIFIVQQSFRHIFQSANDRLQLLFPRYIVPEQNTVGGIKNIKLRLRMGFNIRKNIFLQIFLHCILKIIRRKRFLFLLFLCRLVVHQHVCLVIIFIRPPRLIQLRPVRRILSIRQRAQNVIQQHILVQQIWNIIEHVIIIQIIRNRKLGFLRIC